MKIQVLILQLVLTIFTTHQSFGNQYVDAGIPATDRMWTGQDYLSVLKFIESHQGSLPDFKSEDGESVIVRLTNQENFEFCRDTALSVEQRIQNYLLIAGAFNPIMMCYAEKLYAEKEYSEETAKMLVFTLHLSSLGMDLMHEFLPKIPKDNNYEVRMQGIRQMFSGVTTQFSGAETVLVEKEFFSYDLRVLVLKAMHETMPNLKVAFSPEFKTEMKQRLKNQRKLFDGAEVGLIEEMLNELEAEPVMMDNG